MNETEKVSIADLITYGPSRRSQRSSAAPAQARVLEGRRASVAGIRSRLQPSSAQRQPHRSGSQRPERISPVRGRAVGRIVLHHYKRVCASVPRTQKRRSRTYAIATVNLGMPSGVVRKSIASGRRAGDANTTDASAVYIAGETQPVAANIERRDCR